MVLIATFESSPQLFCNVFIVFFPLPVLFGLLGAQFLFMHKILFARTLRVLLVMFFPKISCLFLPTELFILYDVLCLYHINITIKLFPTVRITCYSWFIPTKKYIAVKYFCYVLNTDLSIPLFNCLTMPFTWSIYLA